MPEGPIPLEFDRSLNRARNRRRVLLSLSSLGEASVGQLARHTGIPWTRVKWILFGHPPSYSRELSLVGVGMAAVKPGRGVGVEITSRGRRKARSVARRWARAAQLRVALRSLEPDKS